MLISWSSRRLLVISPRRAKNTKSVAPFHCSTTFRLTEQIDTRSPAGQLVFHVFGALAEFERNLIRERTLAGLKAARARGRKGGRPKKLTPKELKTIRTLLRSNEVSVQDIAAQFGVNRSTLCRNMTAAAAA